MSENRRRWKDFWTLHVPLVVFVSLSIFASINQFSRWQSGVDRSFGYMIQWPIIGIFAIVVWNRYRKHGSFSNWIGRYYRERAAKFEAEAEAKERAEVAVLDEDPEDPGVEGVRGPTASGGPPWRSSRTYSGQLANRSSPGGDAAGSRRRGCGRSVRLGSLRTPR